MPSVAAAMLTLALIMGLMMAVARGVPCPSADEGLSTFCSATYTVCLDEANEATPPAALPVNLLQCYCDMQACFDPLEEPFCDEVAALLNSARLRAEEAYDITPLTCRGMFDFPDVDDIFGASGCSSAEVAAYLSCTDSFDTCIQDAGISLSPTAFLTMDAAQYKAYAQCYCLDGLACTSTITCQALSNRLTASAPELPPGVSCANVDVAPASAFEVLLINTEFVNPASVPPAASATCAAELELCRVELTACAGARGRFLDASDLQAITTVPDDTDVCFCDFFSCRSATSAICQQTDMIEAARLRALVGDCSEVSSGAGAALRSSASLRVALLVAMAAAALHTWAS